MKGRKNGCLGLCIFVLVSCQGWEVRLGRLAGCVNNVRGSGVNKAIAFRLFYLYCAVNKEEIRDHSHCSN
jgi:hypothetical protein